MFALDDGGVVPRVHESHPPHVAVLLLLEGVDPALALRLRLVALPLVRLEAAALVLLLARCARRLALLALVLLGLLVPVDPARLALVVVEGRARLDPVLLENIAN